MASISHYTDAAALSSNLSAVRSRALTFDCARQTVMHFASKIEVCVENRTSIL